ncbi:hypothetical protein GCM10022254_16200 [Actinomadura meridiana]|uniref:Uncharacterized protein n=1 Tax=Actinomadura meridiana TaxID=559626 RepID=A0ABP8BVZ1_9ACTN
MPVSPVHDPKFLDGLLPKRLTLGLPRRVVAHRHSDKPDRADDNREHDQQNENEDKRYHATRLPAAPIQAPR